MRPTAIWSFVFISVFGFASALTGTSLSELVSPNPMAVVTSGHLDAWVNPSRTAFLGLGLAAIASTYHSAWRSWRSSKRR